MKKIKGVIPPLVTPFLNDKVAITQFHKNLEVLHKHRVNGFVVLGSNGESVLLHEMEKVQLIKAARIVTPDDMALIVGVGMESINGTVRMSKIASDYGADALLIITPHYYKKQMNDTAMLSFFASVADRSKAPILIYNIPAATGISISVDVVRKLSEHDKIIGIKDSSGDLNYLQQLCSTLPENFRVICGNAGIFAPALLAGACGGILGLANALPEPFQMIYRLFEDEKPSEALELQKELQPVIKTSIGDHGVPGVKAAMDIRKMYGGKPRQPLFQCSKEVTGEIDEAIKGLVKNKVISSKKIVS